MNRKNQYRSKIAPVFLSSLLLFPNVAIADVNQVNLSKCHDKSLANTEQCENLDSSIIESIPVFIVMILGIFAIWLIYNIVMIIIVMLKALVWWIQDMTEETNKK